MLFMVKYFLDSFDSKNTIVLKQGLTAKAGFVSNTGNCGFLIFIVIFE